MHVLLTNDDGPLNDRASPYVKHLVDAIRAYTDWDLSIVVPHTQRSWIGKAHFAGKDLTAQFIYPNDKDSNSFIGPFPEPQQEHADKYQEWALLDGTPASCADIGINHIYKHKSPVDLVISGPNFGRNSSSVYITSSGTVGAAMEGVLSGAKAIALSYAFASPELDDEGVRKLKEACKISVKLVEYLYKNWNSNVDLYTINVPIYADLKLGETKIQYAPILENRWASLFKPLIKSKQGSSTDIIDASFESKIQFKWSPNYHSVQDSVDRSVANNEHNDAVVLHNGNVSVTPLKAIFKDVEISGEIKLDSLSITQDQDKEIYLSIDPNSYIFPAIKQACVKYLPKIPFTNSHDIKKKTFQYGEYEELNFDLIYTHTSNYLTNSYIYRKALIRKHYLSHTVHSYTTKTPQSILKTAFPESHQLEVDYAEFLEDSLDESYDLRQSIENGDKIWILKPSMSDRGQGIRIFKTIEQLQTIFDSFEEDATDDEGEHDYTEGNHGIITSQLRHFVVQEYQQNPLLLPQYNNKKFHFRVYVLCNGALEVYVYRRILTLFALSSYTPPKEDSNGEIGMFGHLTNTCLQGEKSLENNSVVEFAKLEGISPEDKQSILKQIYDIVKEVYKAALSVDKMNFQPLPNAFELYGLDFIIDQDLQLKLLEINAFPDFKQTGDDLKDLIYDLFDGVVKQCVVPFFQASSVKVECDNPLFEKVLDQDVNGW